MGSMAQWPLGFLVEAPARVVARWNTQWEEVTDSGGMVPKPEGSMKAESQEAAANAPPSPANTSTKAGTGSAAASHQEAVH